MNSEDFLIVWLDENMDKTIDYFNMKRHLRYVLQYLRTFNDTNECIDFVSSQQTVSIFFLLSETLSEKILPLLLPIEQIVSFYVLCQSQTDYNQQYSKRAGYFLDKNRLVSKLVVDIANLTRNSISICFLEQNSIKSFRDLNKEHASFIWYQLLIEIFLRMDQMDMAKEEMISECLVQYEYDQIELTKIEDFKNNYMLTKAIWWYTRDSFVYRLLNRSLRTENIDQIFKFRFFIKELYKQLKCESVKYKEQLIEYEIETFSVYRGQNITGIELENLRKNINGLVSFNTFLSTTTDRNLAIVYAGDGSRKPEIESILFEIIVNTHTNQTKPFANIAQFSYFDSENEILFFIGTICRIESVKQCEKIWHIKLILCDDDDEQIKQVYTYLKEQIYETTDILTLGSLLIQMGELNKAEFYYNRLLNQMTEENTLQYATIFNQLGLINQRKCNYQLALEQYQKALETFLFYPLKDKSIVSTVYDNIATIYDDLGQFDQALIHYRKSLDIQQNLNNHLSLGITYSNIALTYQQIGDYENAMINYRKSQDTLNNLPAYHPNLAITYGNLGSMFRNIADNEKALAMFKKKLDIELKILPLNHPSLAVTYNNLGVISKEKGDYIHALKMYQSAIDICSAQLMPDHVNIAMTYNNMANIYNETSDYSSAIDCYLKAIEMESKYYPEDHIQLAVTYGNIALAYDGQKNYTDAIQYHRKSIDIQMKSSTLNNDELATSYFNFGSTLKKMSNFSLALEMFEKTLEINLKLSFCDQTQFPVLYNNIGQMHFHLEHFRLALENYNKALDSALKTLRKDHMYFAQIYDNIGLIYKAAGDQVTAIEYFEKSFAIQSTNLPSNHPSIPIVRNMLDKARKALK